MQVLTAGLKGKLLQGRSAGGEIWRRSATELGEVGVGVALRASRSHCQAQSVPVEALQGSQGGLKHTDGMESRWRRCLPAAALRAGNRRYTREFAQRYQDYEDF